MSLPILYHSGHLLVLAQRAYDRASDISSEAEVAVILSAAAFEGFLNDMAHSAKVFAGYTKADEFFEILQEAEEAHLPGVLKYRLGVLALTGLFPKKGDRIIQELDALFRLRNSLIHVRPDRIIGFDEPIGNGRDPKPPKEIQHLINAKVVDSPSAGECTWRQVISTREVARWAHNVAVRGMRELAAVCPAGDFKTVIEFHVQGWEELPVRISPLCEPPDREPT